MRFCLMLGLMVASVLAQANTIPAALNQMMQKHGVAQGELSVWVQAVDADAPLARINGYVARNPASVAKVLTTAAGLLRLGADYRWQTRFYVDNLPDANGVVNGNLYIKGGADPFLVEERLLEMVQGLRGKGVRHISGDVVLDDDFYRLTRLERDGASFDGQPTEPYNAVPDPLMVNFRTVKVALTPDGANAVAVDLAPNIASWQVDNQMTVNNRACNKGYAPSLALRREANGRARLVVAGSYSRQCGAKELVTVLGEASEQFYYWFSELWAAAGGSFDGVGQLDTVPTRAKLIYVGQSLPLAELIQKMNQFSNNVMTRQLLLTLGVHDYGEPGSLDKGRRAVLTILEEFGIDTAGMVIDNGAGLSRNGRVSAAQLVMLLRSLYYSNKAETFMRSLAVAGESGTLRKRLRGEAVAGNVIGKTGTIDQVRSFAGYVRAQSGRNYVVVMMVNGQTAAKSRAMQDDLFRWVFQQ